MAIEKEIKLSLPPHAVDAARACLERLCGRPGQTLHLRNRYFDTPQRELAAARMALRLRHTGHAWLQTLKAGGSAVAGLHQRHEWEMPVSGARLELPTLIAACGDEAIGLVLRQVGQRLEALFDTDFTRTVWQWGEVEVALDQGEVSTMVDGKKKTAPILEIELELKGSDDAQLQRAAQRLLTDLPELKPDDVSKAQRGYALRGGDQP